MKTEEVRHMLLQTEAHSTRFWKTGYIPTGITFSDLFSVLCNPTWFFFTFFTIYGHKIKSPPLIRSHAFVSVKKSLAKIDNEMNSTFFCLDCLDVELKDHKHRKNPQSLCNSCCHDCFSTNEKLQYLHR